MLRTTTLRGFASSLTSGQASRWMITGAVAAAMLLGGSATASAQYGQQAEPSFMERFHRDYYRNKMWPAPFREDDTRSILSYFDTQRDNGWKLHNTIGASMFHAQTGKLTDSGLAQIRWIVKRAPQARRVIFVLEGQDRKTTARRVEATQLAVSGLIPVGPLPEIYLTDRDAPGSSGAYQTAVYRAMTDSVPAPRLPAAATTP